MILVEGDKKLQQLVENLQLMFVIDVKYLLLLVLWKISRKWKKVDVNKIDFDWKRLSERLKRDN